uniref:Uncharacterized protein n=1 Tax=Arundo donax TaxID=35708 RepID=A0A0A9CDM3_ARUDO
MIYCLDISAQLQTNWWFSHCQHSACCFRWWT